MADNLTETRISDERLIAAALSGDLAAFGTLVERYWGVVFAMALSRLAERAEAEDAAQESFLKAYAQLHKLRDPARFAGWLSRITVQQCTNTVRRNVRRRAALAARADIAEPTEAMPAYSPNPGLTESQIRFVRTRVSRLPEKTRNVVLMRFVGGFSAVQIARQLGQKPGTVRVWLHRAYNILRKDLAPLLEEVQS